jgi:hypothetical protein
MLGSVLLVELTESMPAWKQFGELHENFEVWTFLNFFELLWTILNYFELLWTSLNFFESWFSSAWESPKLTEMETTAATKEERSTMARGQRHLYLPCLIKAATLQTNLTNKSLADWLHS